MFDYIDSSGNVITYDQINKMAKEGKTSFAAIIKKNGYKQKPKPNNTQYGKALLSNTPNQVIGPKVKKDTPVIATKKKEPVVEKAVVQNKQTFTPSLDPFAGTDLAQSKIGGQELLLSNEYKKEKAKKLQEEKKQLEIDEAATKAREAKRVNERLLTENKPVFEKANDYIASIGLNVTEKEEQSKKAEDEINGNTFFEKTKGVINQASDVRNYGIQKAHSNWIAFLDDDDTIADDYVEIFYNEQQIFDFDIYVFRMKMEQRIIPSHLCFDFKICDVGISFVCHKNVFHKIMFQNSHTEDFEFLDNARKKNYKIVISNTIKYFVKEIYNKNIIYFIN